MLVERKWKWKRKDVTVSFHGDEVLFWDKDGNPKYTNRDLAKRLHGGLLQRRWVTRGHVGILSIFMDKPDLRKSVDGRLLRRILGGFLQTRGGGIVVILATPGFFRSSWCLTELSCAIKLFSQGPDVAQIRLCFIGVGMSVDAMKNSWFMKEHGLPEVHEVQYEAVKLEEATQDTEIEHAMSNAVNAVADRIVDRASGGVLAGETQDDTLVNLVKAIIKLLQSNANRSQDYEDFMDCFAEGNGRLQITTLIKRLGPQELVRQLKKFLDERVPSSVIENCRERVEAYEQKWTSPWCSTNWDASLEELMQVRPGVAELLKLRQHQVAVIQEQSRPSEEHHLPPPASHPAISQVSSNVSETSTGAVKEAVVNELLDKLVETEVVRFWCPWCVPFIHWFAIFVWVNRMWPIIEAPAHFSVVFFLFALSCWPFPCGLWKYAPSGIGGNPKQTAVIVSKLETEEYVWRRCTFFAIAVIVLALNVLFQHGGPSRSFKLLSAFLVAATVANFRLLQLRALNSLWGEIFGLSTSILLGGAPFFCVDMNFTTHAEVSKLMAWSWCIQLCGILVAKERPNWNTVMIASLSSAAEMLAICWMRLEVESHEKPNFHVNTDASRYFCFVVAAVCAGATWVTMESSFKEFKKELNKQLYIKLRSEHQ